MKNGTKKRSSSKVRRNWKMLWKVELPRGYPLRKLQLLSLLHPLLAALGKRNTGEPGLPRSTPSTRAGRSSNRRSTARVPGTRR